MQLSHVRALAAGGNHLPFHEKSEESFPRGGSPPTPVTPTPTTVQQLLRRAQIRRNERRTPDPHDESAKKPRVPSPPLNNNDATPTDFSMVKNNHLSSKVEGNGVHEENSPLEDNIKCEPLELTGGNSGNGGNNEDSSDSGAAASDRPPASASSNEHEAESEHTSTPNFLSETKIFPTPGSFNFSMAALATEHTPLSGTYVIRVSTRPVRIDQFSSSTLHTRIEHDFLLTPFALPFIVFPPVIFAYFGFSVRNSTGHRLISHLSFFFYSFFILPFIFFPLIRKVVLEDDYRRFFPSSLC